MSITFTVNARDEKIQTLSSWFSPDDAACGITVDIESTKIYLTSSQLDEIVEYWERNKAEVKANLCKHLLGHKEESSNHNAISSN